MRGLILLAGLFLTGCGFEGWLHHTINRSHPYKINQIKNYVDPPGEPVLFDHTNLKNDSQFDGVDKRFYSGFRDRLEKRADELLLANPPSVTESPTVYENQQINDYVSLAIYWWPNPSRVDGKPYIRRDGEINPETEMYDYPKLRKMAESVRILALAGHIFDVVQYSKQAERFLDTWFCSPETRMSPHLRFAQGIPGRTEGRNYGIIDTYHFISLLDAIYLMRVENRLTDELNSCLYSWFDAFTDWLLISGFGIREANKLNNHGTWYDAQLTAYATFLGRDQLAKHILRDITQRRILNQIDADGKQPREMRRADGLHYLIYNLEAYKNLVRYGWYYGINVFSAEDEHSERLTAAISFVNYQANQLEPDNPYLLYWKVVRAQMLNEPIRVSAPATEILLDTYLADLVGLNIKPEFD